MNGNATRDPRLERYLSSLESALKPFPVSDRAEIITEIKSHVLDALERDPNTSVESVLSALGEPETVANRYLLERGLKTAKPPISPIVKWLIIGFLGTVAMLLLFSGFLVTQFAPIVSINEREDKVSILGGLIQINGDEKYAQNGSTQVAEGQAIEVKFTNGTFEIVGTDQNQFSWKCSGQGIENAQTKALGEVVVFDVSGIPKVNCELEVPRLARFSVDGSNGKLDLSNVNFHIAAKLLNGKIDFESDGKSAYQFDVKATNGHVDTFTSTEQTDETSGALSVKLEVLNGSISN